MLLHAIRTRNGRERLRPRRRPLLLALFSFRYDAHLVPDLLQNLEPIVDGWIAFDDRCSDEFYSDEPTRRRALLVRARELGADWVLGIDPDERLERGAAEGIREMTKASGPVAWGFRLREMYTPSAYRVDGVWGQKVQFRLFPLITERRFSDQPLHGLWFPAEPKHTLLRSDLNLYHLKMIAPERRRARRDLYKYLDPSQRYQAIGYDYLADDVGLVLEEVPADRSYFPPHTEDGLLWMPAPPADGEEDAARRRPVPDLAVVVMSVGAPVHLVRAVGSLLAQGVPLEIVVVNSGGGDPIKRLRRFADKIRIIDREGVLWPGATRNVGITATSAPFVAFLESDCTAQAGWAEHRLRRHREGAPAVATALLNSNPGNPFATASHYALFGRRLPGVPEVFGHRYGASFARALFEEYGLFRADLRTGEDTEFADRLPDALKPVWAPDVCAAHANPTDPITMLTAISIAAASGRPPRTRRCGRVCGRAGSPTRFGASSIARASRCWQRTGARA